MSKYNTHLLVCAGTGCHSSESNLVYEMLRDEVMRKGLDKTVQIIRTGCFGFCEKGPILKILPDNTFYTQVKPTDAREIIDEHVIKGRKVTRLLYADPETNSPILNSTQMSFYKKQLRVALRNCGAIDPENIDESIARDAYQALGKVLLEYTPQETIDVIKQSGLRGRGGAGFSTGLKWELTARNESTQKYVVCNADEGDPGAFMDRSILEGDPHVILEAMAICGFCIGANKGLIYIRAEYPMAIKRLKIAISQAKEYGLMGERIFDSDFSFDITLKYGAGAFVCGEETALIHSISGETHLREQRGDFCQRAGDHPQGCRLVLFNWNGQVERDQSVCPRRKDQQRGTH